MDFFSLPPPHNYTLTPVRNGTIRQQLGVRARDPCVASEWPLGTYKSHQLLALKVRERVIFSLEPMERGAPTEQRPFALSALLVQAAKQEDRQLSRPPPSSSGTAIVALLSRLGKRNLKPP